MFIHRDSERLLRSLDGAPSGSPEHAALGALGAALRELRPPADAPDPVFASSLKARLTDRMPMEKRFTLAQAMLPALGVAALAALAFVLTRPDSGFQLPDSSAFGGDLTLAQGTVEYRSDAAAAWQGASEGLALAEGMEIRTGAGGRAVLSLDDGSVVRLNAKTAVALSALGRDAIEVAEDSGTAYYRLAKDARRTFVVRTAEGTVTALGTAFAVARDGEKKKLEINCLESKVKVALASGDAKLEKHLKEGETLTVDGSKPLEAATATSDIDPKKIAEVPFFNWNLREDAKGDAPLGVVKETPKVALAILNPANGAKLPVGPVTVAGTTEPGMTVVVNGVKLVADDSGAWSTTVDLAKGFQTVTITVEDPLAGDATAKLGLTIGEEPKPALTAGIKLSATADGTAVKLAWSVTGVDVSKGFKVVKSLEPNPIYPGNSAQYMDAAARSLVLKLDPLKTYYFRVCAYTGDGCSVYSNNASVKTGEAPVKTTASGFAPISGELALAVSGPAGGVVLEWTQCTAVDFQYYKVVRSDTDANPYYPKSGYLTAISSISSTRFVDKSAVAGKTYYYRVCSVDGGAVFCGNVVTYTVPIQ
jgi:hypothetical protein